MTVFHDAQLHAEQSLASKGLTVIERMDLQCWAEFMKAMGAPMSEMFTAPGVVGFCEIVYRDSRPVGCVAVRRHDEADIPMPGGVYRLQQPTARRGGLFVAPDMRGQKIGEDLALLSLGAAFCHWPDVQHCISERSSVSERISGHTYAGIERTFGPIRDNFAGKETVFYIAHCGREEAAEKLRALLGHEDNG